MEIFDVPSLDHHSLGSRRRRLTHIVVSYITYVLLCHSRLTVIDRLTHIASLSRHSLGWRRSPRGWSLPLRPHLAHHRRRRTLRAGGRGAAFALL